MSGHNLEFLFRPRAVALVGASDRPHSVGATVMRNLLGGGFAGPVWPVNLRHAQVAGQRAYARVAQLPGTPDLAVICTPGPTVPGIVAELAAAGCRAAIVISAGLEQPAADGGTLLAAALAAARPHGLRLLGPNCLGVLVPGIGLNASFAHVGARAGSLAFVAQSGALTTAMLDWAQATGVGFSHFISLGNAADVDFGDLLDWLGQDPHTSAILLYLESVTAARKFMSAARAAARAKPVIAVKSGRSAAAARVAQSHSGALAGSDAVYDAALRRAGVVRVDTLRQLFDAAEIIGRWRDYAGPRLAILGNGGGPAVMATDALASRGGTLATLAEDTVRRLTPIVPAGGSRLNPLDLGGDAGPERYCAVLEVLLRDPGVDAVLLMHAPTAVAGVPEIAAACLPVLAQASRPTLACWLGAPVAPHAGVPAYNTPEEAVEAFGYVVQHAQRQALLLEVPTVAYPHAVSDAAAARRVVEAALAQGRTVLTEPESKAVLAAYGIPVIQTRIVHEVAALAAAAEAVGYPVALKILSADISHKSDVGGVALDLETPAALQAAAASMLQRCGQLRPAARIEGFTVQRMVRRGGALELIAGVVSDPAFGPAILFGQGGTGVELIADTALALPPLNHRLARELIARTRVHGLLGAHRGRPPVDLAALADVLINLGRLAAELPELVELDINPLLADAHGVLALDARIHVESRGACGVGRFAIRPYPAELEQRMAVPEGMVLLRPVRPEDFARYREFLARVTPADLRARFFEGRHGLAERDVARLTQIDYEREMAFIAVGEGPPRDGQILGIARASTDPDNERAEFALLVRSDLKGRGLGHMLLAKLVDYCRQRGTSRLTGNVLAGNEPMLRLGARFGFAARQAGAGVVDLDLPLR